MNWITAKLYIYYMQSGHFSHIITYLTTLLIFYYGLVRTEKSKHTVFKLISISVSSLNELSQSGVFWLVGFWFLLPDVLKTLPVTTPMWHQVQQEHASCSDCPAHHLAPLWHAGLHPHRQIPNEAPGCICSQRDNWFCYEPVRQVHTSFKMGQKINYASSNENQMDNYK